MSVHKYDPDCMFCEDPGPKKKQTAKVVVDNSLNHCIALIQKDESIAADEKHLAIERIRGAAEWIRRGRKTREHEKKNSSNF